MNLRPLRRVGLRAFSSRSDKIAAIMATGRGPGRPYSSCSCPQALEQRGQEAGREQVCSHAGETG